MEEASLDKNSIQDIRRHSDEDVNSDLGNSIIDIKHIQDNSSSKQNLSQISSSEYSNSEYKARKAFLQIRKKSITYHNG